MNMIEKKVRAARRRLVLANFAFAACWTFSVAWLCAGVAILISALWGLPGTASAEPAEAHRVWSLAWLVGSSIVAFLAASVWAWIISPSVDSAAAEVDTRFSMKQRLRSALSLSTQDQQTPMGQALVADALRRAEQLEIREKFKLAPSRVGLLPLVPACLLLLAFLLSPATHSIASARPTPEMQAAAKQLKKSAEALKKKLSEQRKKAEATGLKDAAETFTKLEADLDKMAKRDAIDPKEALIAINDLKKQLDERRKQLGSPESMRQSLAKMSDSEKGPAESIVKAMKEGDFEAAKEQAKTLAEKLRNNQLTQEEKDALKKQVEALRDQLQQAAEKHEAEKQELQRKIDEAKRNGQGKEAAKLQQQLNEKEAQDGQMQKMQQMGDAMNAAAEAMAKGDAEAAAEAMEGMASELAEMQGEMEQLQDIQETLDTLSQTKDQMRCKQCQGQGCQSCKGNGNGLPKDGSGRGGTEYGLGKGTGASGEEDNLESQSFESQVRGEPKQGRGLQAGFADGPNKKGVTREDVKQAVLGAISDESDPLENQVLPRAERSHAQEYFDKLRSGR